MKNIISEYSFKKHLKLLHENINENELGGLGRFGKIDPSPDEMPAGRDDNFEDKIQEVDNDFDSIAEFFKSNRYNDVGGKQLSFKDIGVDDEENFKNYMKDKTLGRPAERFNTYISDVGSEDILKRLYNIK